MTDPLAPIDFLVQRADLRQTDVRELPLPANVHLDDGEILVAVERFAFTANNVTYAALGDKFSYWRFFPGPEGWGRIPVWGFGTVERSNAAGVEVGERLYGYFPMSTHVVFRPANVKEWGFVDGAPHRAELFPLYNQYMRTRADPAYDAAKEPEQMLLRPLFVTSFVLDDFLDEHAFFEADTIVLSSASSKTAIGLAFLLAERRKKGAPIEVVGLTSPRNVAFVEKLGCYSHVLTYDALATLPGRGLVHVDFAGSGPLIDDLQKHAGERLLRTYAVGFTHWDEGESTGPKSASPREVFFAPAQIRKRLTEWGAAGFQSRLGDAWRSFVLSPDGTSKWLRIHEKRGVDAVRQTYLDVLDGRINPNEGLILSL